MNKAASGGRDFKKLIAELGNDVPGLGVALKAVFNPIAATIAGATLALGYFRNKLAEWNADMDRQSDEAATPMANFAHATERAALKVAEHQRAYKKWSEEMVRTNDDLLDGLKRQLETLESQSKVNKTILQQTKDKQSASIQASIAGGRMTPEQGAAAQKKMESNFASAQSVMAYRQLQAEQAARQATKDALNKKMNAANFKVQTISGEDINSRDAQLRIEKYPEEIAALEAKEKAAKEVLKKAQDAGEKFQRAPATPQELAGMDSHTELAAAKVYAEGYRKAHGTIDSAASALATVQGDLKAANRRKLNDTELLRDNAARQAKAESEALAAKGQMQGVDDQLHGGGLRLNEMLMGMTPAERMAALGKKQTPWQDRMKSEQEAWKNKLKSEQDAWNAKTQGYQNFIPTKKDEAGATDILTAIEALTKAATEQGIIVKKIANG